VLSYRKGYYIQVLEGDAASVDRLFSNILKDSRHESVTVIMDFPIAQRAFPDWDMKLLESVNKDARFTRFVSNNFETVKSLGQHQQRLFEIFYQLDNRASNVTENYDDHDLMLSAWPDFTALKPSPVIIELCARLTKKPHAYKVLRESGEFGTQQQLDKILNKFEMLEILTVTGSSGQANFPSPANEPTSFYAKMKDFLRLR